MGTEHNDILIIVYYKFNGQLNNKDSAVTAR